MKTSIDHLPVAKQRELARIVEILHEEFDDALKLATSEKKKRGRILKIILFGSYARGGWVEDHGSGYLSDYDLLIVVNRHELTDFADIWYKAEDRLIRSKLIKIPVQFIVHSLQDVNSQLAEGRYFFSDIAREGIALYELKGHQLNGPKPPTPQLGYDMAKEYFDEGLARSRSYLETVKFLRNKPEREHQNHAAFELHQAAEHAYGTLLLTLTLYKPQSHNVEFLRSLAEDIAPDLIGAWPRDQRRSRRMFQLLKRAYVEARYSKHYKITPEELEWQEARVKALQDSVERTCKKRLSTLEAPPKT